MVPKEQKKHRKENSKLQQANIETLKSNEKTVTIISKSETKVTSIQRVSDSDIKRHLINKMRNILGRIIHEMVNNPHPFRRGDSFMDHRMHHFEDIRRFEEVGGMSYLHNNLRDKEV